MQFKSKVFMEARLIFPFVNQLPVLFVFILN